MDIPGFQIERELGLGRSQRSRVYLASRLHPYRRVVIKAAHCADGDAASRLHRLRSHKSLQPGFRHPHIVHVESTGAHGPYIYLVMEYLEGGTLDQNLAWGMGVPKLLAAVGGICDALDYLHGEGLILGGLSPANILFRSEVEAVLGELCSLQAVAVDEVPPDAHRRSFLSPEQQAGAPVDPRSDLFSLGAVLHNALTGEVLGGLGANFGRSGDLLALAPRLPVHLRPLQPVLEQALATDPERRFQSGAALKSALEAVRRTGRLKPFTVKTEAVTVQEIRRTDSELGFVHREPLGGFERGPRRRSSWGWWAAVGLGLALAAGAFLWAPSPSRWMPALLAQVGLAEDPALQSALAEAQSLREDPDEKLSSVVAGYRRVLALDSGSEAALQAIAELSEQWRQSVSAALQRNDLESAAANLAEMEVAFPNDGRLVDLERELINRQAASTLLGTTQALLRNQGLSQIPAATVAIQTYQEVLRLAPGHAGALAELDALADHYAGLAQQALEQGKVDEAIIYLERATTANDQLPILALVRERIQQATAARTTIEELLQQASVHRAEGFLVHPPGENAAQLYNRVLATAPDNGIALQGLDEIISRLLTDAARMFEDGNLSGVEALLDQARTAGIDAGALDEIKANLDQRVQALATINEKLEEAEALLGQGFITAPQDASAVSLLRDIQRLDPDNARAGELLEQAALRLAAVAQEAFAAGLLSEARHYLDLALTLKPDQTQWRELRQSWQ